ncbi:MAG: hypothetical protein LM590_10375 [Thermofilum sp.]|nr:hypothetical protein [Thermofilum sp.]
MYLLIIQAIAYGLAYLVLQKIENARKHPFSDYVGMQIAFGIMLIVAISYLAYFFSFFAGLISFFIVCLSIIGLVFKLLHMFRKGSDIILKGQWLYSVATLLVIDSLLSYIIGYMKWPPFGDVLTHNMITALLLFNRAIPKTYYPLTNNPFYYPAGFHVFACFITDLTSLYPGESILIESGLILAAIITAAFEIAIKISRTRLAGPIVVLLLFWSQGTKYNTEFLFGYFLNGTYPMLLATLGIILFAFVYSKPLTQESLLIQILIAFVLLVTYPTFFLFVFIPLIISMLRILAKYAVKNLFRLKKLIILSILTICVLIVVSPKLSIWVQQNLYHLRIFQFTEEYKVQSHFLLSSQTGLMILTSIIISFIYLFLGRDRSGNLIAILMSFPAIINVAFPKFEGIGLLLPLRSLIGASPLLFSYLIGGVFLLIQTISAKLHLNRRAIVLRFNGKKLVEFYISRLLYFMLSLILIISLVPAFYEVLTLQIINKRCWLWSQNPGFTDDYNVAAWIASHEPNLKILIDYSQPSYQLFGFGLINTTTYNRDFVYILKHPMDTPLVSTLVSNTGIKRIYLSSDERFYDYEYSAKNPYIVKPFSTDDYIKAFSNLTIVEFRSGRAAVLRFKELPQTKFSPLAVTDTYPPNPTEWNLESDIHSQSNILLIETSEKSSFRYSIKGIFFDAKPGYRVKIKYSPLHPIDLSNRTGLHLWYRTNQQYDKTIGIGLILIDTHMSWVEYRDFVNAKSFRINEWCPAYFSLKNPYSSSGNFDFKQVDTMIIYLVPSTSGTFEFSISNLAVYDSP